jgi:acyl-CoA thioester hydrolase
MTESDSERQINSCSVEFRVRYAECDPMGFLYHGKYWEYFEIARTELLRRQGLRYRDLEATGTFFVVYKAACKYLRPIRYDDEITIRVRVERMTPARVDHSYEIVCDGERKCEATTTLACIGRDGRPRTMPDSM